eukprot:2927835-Alexandrium_andersonii.AAC.1
MLALADVQPNRVGKVERALGLQRWASRRATPVWLQLGPRGACGPSVGAALRLHPPPWARTSVGFWLPM